MGLFDKLINRAESLSTHVQDAFNEIKQDWSLSDVEQKLRRTLARMVVQLAKQSPNAETESQLRNNNMAILLELANGTSKVDLNVYEEDERVNRELLNQLDNLVEYLIGKRPALSPLVDNLPVELAPMIREIEGILIEINELEEENSQVSAERQARRETLEQEYAEMAEKSDYSELEKTTALADLTKTMSVGRSIVESLYDIPRLEAEVHENPQNPMGYVNLAEALIRSRTTENIRKGISAVFNPRALVVDRVGSMIRGAKGGIAKEVALARTSLCLSRRSLEQDPMDFWALAAAGRAYLLLGEPLLAAKYLKTAALLRPDCADLYYYLAQAYATKESMKNTVSYLVYGAKLGSYRCAVSLHETIEDFEEEAEESLHPSIELRERLMRVIEEQEKGEEGTGVLEQFLEDKTKSFGRLGKRLERAMDTFVGVREETR